jgi:hypothetical protein
VRQQIYHVLKDKDENFDSLIQPCIILLRIFNAMTIVQQQIIAAGIQAVVLAPVPGALPQAPDQAG